MTPHRVAAGDSVTLMLDLGEPGGADAAPVALLTGLPRTRHGRGAPPGAAARTAGAAARAGARSAAPRRPARRRGGLARSRRAPRCKSAGPSCSSPACRSDRGECAALIEELRRRAAAPARGRAGRRRQRLRAFAAGQRARCAHRLPRPRAHAGAGGHAGARRGSTPVWPADIDNAIERSGRVSTCRGRRGKRAVQAARGASMRRSALRRLPCAARSRGPAAELTASPPAASRSPAASMKTSRAIAGGPRALRCSALIGAPLAARTALC